jgi:hypothetical protein
MHGFLEGHLGHLILMRFAFLSLHSTKRGSLFRPAEPSSTRTLRPNWRGQSSRNILLRPLSKASVTKVDYATALL